MKKKQRLWNNDLIMVVKTSKGNRDKPYFNLPTNFTTFALLNYAIKLFHELLELFHELLSNLF